MIDFLQSFKNHRWRNGTNYLNSSGNHILLTFSRKTSKPTFSVSPVIIPFCFVFLVSLHCSCLIVQRFDLCLRRYIKKHYYYYEEKTKEKQFYPLKKITSCIHTFKWYLKKIPWYQLIIDWFQLFMHKVIFFRRYSLKLQCFSNQDLVKGCPNLSEI